MYHLLVVLLSHYVSLHLLLHGVSSVPILNVEVVSLATNGAATSAIVLPAAAGASVLKDNKSNDAAGKPVILADNSAKAVNQLSSSSILDVSAPGDARGLASNRSSTSDAARDAILKLIDQPGNGKSFFDQTPNDKETKPTENLKKNSEGKSTENSKERDNLTLKDIPVIQLTDETLAKSPGPSVEGKFTPGIKALSEKPLITSPPGIEANEKPKPEEKNTTNLVPAPKNTDDRSPKPQVGSKLIASSTEETVGSEKKKQENNEPANKAGKDPAKNDVNLIGKDLKPLLQKPTITATTKDDNIEKGVFLAVGQDSEETPLTPEALLASENKNGEKKPDPSSGNAEVTKSSSMETPATQGQQNSQIAPERPAPMALPTIDPGNPPGPEPNPKAPKAPTPPLPKANPTPPPSEQKAPESTEGKVHEADPHKNKLAASKNTNLNVIKGDSASAATKESQAGKEQADAKHKTEEQGSNNLVFFIVAGVSGFLLMIAAILIIAKMKQKKEKKILVGEEKAGGHQSEIPIGFGSGEGPNEISVPISPPMSLSGRSQRTVPISLPPPRGDDDLDGGMSAYTNMRYSKQSSRNEGRLYENDDGGEYGPYEGSAYNESEFYDNSRYRHNDEYGSRGRESLASRGSNTRSIRPDRSRFPYNRR